MFEFDVNALNQFIDTREADLKKRMDALQTSKPQDQLPDAPELPETEAVSAGEGVEGAINKELSPAINTARRVAAARSALENQRNQRKA